MSIYKKDLITVIVTTYNPNLKYLIECLESIKFQSYKKLEIIIIDDFSKNISDILNLVKLRFGDLKIKILRNRKNFGVSYSLNKAIKHSKGKYINWCSYDDYFLKDKIMKQHQLIRNTTNYIVSCDYLVRYEKFNFYKYSKSISIKNKFSFLFNDIYSGGTFLIPKNIFKLTNGFDLSLRHIQDYDLWLRLSLKNVQFVNLNQALFVSRQHQEQHSFSDQIGSFIEKEKFYNLYVKKNILNFLYYLNFYQILNLCFSLITRGYYKVSKTLVRSYLEFAIKKNFNKTAITLLYYIILSSGYFYKNIRFYFKKSFFYFVYFGTFFKR
jgi:glycosyltransferase involved in cell wall biosynthesis